MKPPTEPRPYSSTYLLTFLQDYGIIDEVLSSKVRVPNPARPELSIAA